MLYMVISMFNLNVIDGGIVGKRREETYASTENRNELYTDTVFMYIYLKVLMDGDTLYLTNYSGRRLIVKGDTVPCDRVHLFNEFLNPDLNIYIVEWRKVESISETYCNYYSGILDPDSIEYSDSVFTVRPLSDTSGVVADPISRFKASHHVKLPDFLGTMRYTFIIYRVDMASMKVDTLYAFPWRRYCHRLGIGREVYRVSYRLDNSVTGWATSFFNLPYIFGSLSIYEGTDWDRKESPSRRHQAERYIGADCADFVTFAWRRYQEQRHKRMMEYGYSAKFVMKYRVILYSEDLDVDTAGVFIYRGRRVKFISDTLYRGNGVYVKPGDIVVLGARRGNLRDVWHSVMLFRDEGVEGYFDGKDLIVETLGEVPHVIRFSSYEMEYFAVVRVEN